jgi:FlaG/FlaF family flagellin (archaellin)
MKELVDFLAVIGIVAAGFALLGAIASLVFGQNPRSRDARNRNQARPGR